jgi:GTP-binding protein
MTTNKYNKAQFLLSVNKFEQLPVDAGMEVAFAGRSNVGKSSAINVITGNHRLARTSKTPGRTQLLNFFELDDQRRLVDLPGYGYAKVPAQIQRHWGKLLDRYFQERQSLAGLVLIMDIRHPLKPYDEQMLNWCNSARLPVHVLLNKSDKLSRGAAQNCLQEVSKRLTNEAVSLQLFSALKRSGLEQARQVLDEWFSA